MQSIFNGALALNIIYTEGNSFSYDTLHIAVITSFANINVTALEMRL